MCISVYMKKMVLQSIELVTLLFKMTTFTTRLIRIFLNNWPEDDLTSEGLKLPPLRSGPLSR